MKKLAIITTHPIQYNAPLFQLLTERGKVAVKVFYTWEKAQNQVFDPGFQKVVSWDLPLLEGYDYSFVKNKNNKSNKKSFWSIINPTLIKEIEDWGANSLLVYGWNYYSHLRALKYFKNKIPIYFRGDSTLLDKKSFVKSFITKVILSKIYKYVDLALYVGESNRQYFLTNGLKNNQLLFVPHAIDNDRFLNFAQEGSCHEEIKNKKASLGIQPHELVFLFAGKFNPKKNPQILIDSFLDLKKRDAHLVLVGNGLLENHLKNRYSVNSKVHFIDFHNQKEMPLMYRLADVFVLPSKGPAETWGLAVNEAMACEKPVIVSDKVGCAVDLVMEGKNGFVFKHNDIEDLKMKLAEFSDKSICEKMGKNSKVIIEPYNFEQICEVIEKEINKLV